MKPFLKWVGGKTQIIDDIVSKFPSEMENYHEIFLGGGSVLLALLEKQKEGSVSIRNSVRAYDINRDLINVYRNVQSRKEELYSKIEEYMLEFKGCEGAHVNRKPSTVEEAMTSKESFYYWMRQLYNTMDKDSIDCSALFMILNKLCFRGLYRVGPNGFNVPYGHYKTTPTIISRDHLDSVSDLIKDVTFESKDFTESLALVSCNDFVYLDPPYAPEKATSFDTYTADGFGIGKHEALFDLVRNIGARFVMSNADVKIVTEAFSGYSIEKIMCRRAINSKKPQSTTTEVIISN